MDAQEALEKLKQGNLRFVQGKPASKNLTLQRTQTALGQKPYAAVLTCSDSRVSPEHIFDAGIGEIFVVRTAGNLADSIALGSLEYAAQHLHVPIVLVLGHTSCGAINAACSSQSASGNLKAIIDALQEAVALGKKDPQKTVKENVNYVLSQIRQKSKAISQLEREGKIKLLGAIYSIESGQVSFI
ncbi:MAG: carbonic anhydrase [Candidatus Anstonellaceae archaeon]